MLAKKGPDQNKTLHEAAQKRSMVAEVPMKFYEKKGKVQDHSPGRVLSTPNIQRTNTLAPRSAFEQVRETKVEPIASKLCWSHKITTTNESIDRSEALSIWTQEKNSGES